MKTLELDMSISLAAAVKALKGEPVVLLEGNVPVGVLLPVENADLETVSLSLNPEFLGIIERSRQRLNREGGISSTDIRQRLGVKTVSEEKPGTGRRRRKAN